MARLPRLNGDENQWGALLNEFLLVSHHEDGLLRGTYVVTNVKDFGALGDGTADDTVAIQTAISTLPHGGVVYLSRPA